MTKKYCDVCGKEIIADSQFGMFITFFKVSTFDPKTQTAGMAVDEKHIELCEECVKQVSVTIDNLKK